MLKEIAPRTVRIGVIYDPANAAQRLLPDLERSLSPGIQVVSLSVSSRSDVESDRADGSRTEWRAHRFAGPLAVAHRDLIITLAVKFHLPLLYPYRYFTAAGGLISYDLVDQYRVVASYIDRILKGEKPADQSVQFPTKYMLVINLNTAKALGLTVPDKLLALADEVIE
jgi:putative ABC transport system substrate-binding protein